MKFQVTFTVDVDWCEEGLGPVKEGDPLMDRIEDSVAEAVADALQAKQSMGFCHDMENEISILADSEVVVKFLE